ncbi:uncharacterized protein LOC110988265 isoform X2 [Acanthaster planci]|uniref:Uncharacterized protein LOC110988265 isoform X2 n=1 Tax=Acanthaster planci TaxID=133434 RepID=A0A8B7ZNZ6_ACAPL|nr:uncharacterized protein LOC110988265 isoform X2 [Acanthaster planci]
MISYSGVCHSDIHFWEGRRDMGGGKIVTFLGRPGFNYPCIPGHEIAGVLSSLGEGVTDISRNGLKLGDRVVVFPWIFCNACGFCKADYNVLCDGPPTQQVFYGTTYNGGLAQYVSVPNIRYVVPLSASIPLPVACLLPCSGLTAFHVIEEALEFVKTVTKVKGCCSVMAIGVGGVGQWGVRLARALFPPETQIICADVKQEALDVVTSNVRDTVPLLMDRDQPSDSIARQVKTVSRSGRGVDVILDFVGATKTFEIGKLSMQMCGQYIVTGLLGGEVRMPLPDVVLTGVTIKGILMGRLTQLKTLLELVVKMPSIYDNLTYSVHPLEDGVQIMEKLAKGQVVGRAILKCNDDGE